MGPPPPKYVFTHHHRSASVSVHSDIDEENQHRHRRRSSLDDISHFSDSRLLVSDQSRHQRDHVRQSARMLLAKAESSRRKSSRRDYAGLKDVEDATGGVLEEEGRQPRMTTREATKGTMEDVELNDDRCYNNVTDNIGEIYRTGRNVVIGGGTVAATGAGGGQHKSYLQFNPTNLANQDDDTTSQYFFSKTAPKSYDTAVEELEAKRLAQATANRGSDTFEDEVGGGARNFVEIYEEGGDGMTGGDGGGADTHEHFVNYEAFGDRVRRRRRFLYVAAIGIIVGIIFGVMYGVTWKRNQQGKTAGEDIASTVPARPKPEERTPPDDDDTTRPEPPRPSPDAPPSSPGDIVVPVLPTLSDDTPALPEEELIDMLRSVTPKAILTDSTTPQNRALQWLLSDPYTSTRDTLQIYQRYVLATLYHSLSGPLWTTNADDGVDDESNQKWLTSHHECHWIGVRCGRDFKNHNETNVGDDTGGGELLPRVFVGEGYLEEAEEETVDVTVTYLNLSNGGLVGSLPDEVGELRYLTQLYLYDNDLTGSIPTSMLQLVNLHTLYLDKNRLTGTIPNAIGSLGKLENLDLSDNNFHGTIPNGIGDNEKLADLRLSNNDLTGEFPIEIVDLNNLVTVLLDNNAIEGTIPDAMGSLQNLAVLRLQGNELFGEIPHFESPLLEELHLDDNALSGPVANVLDAKKLRELHLEKNRLSGSLPSEIGTLTELEVLRLDFNELTGSVPVMNLDKLREMQLEGNSLTGTMPQAICELDLPLLSADCSGSTPEVECSCCSDCLR